MPMPMHKHPHTHTQILSEVDGDKDGLLSEGEWYEVEVWFQYRVFQPGSDADPEAQYASEGDREAARRAAYDRCVGHVAVV